MEAILDRELPVNSQILNQNKNKQAMTVNSQLKNKVWTDEAGQSIPVSHIKTVEKNHEKITSAVATAAMKVSAAISKFKSQMDSQIEEGFQAMLKEYKGTKEDFKGNVTLYNFDRSIKIERRVSERIHFDEMTIQMAKMKLEEFLKDGISAKDEVIKSMVLEAFSTARGKLDVKKILGLKRYADRIKDSRYAEAMSLIDQAIRRPDSATYFQIWIKNAAGQYEAVPLALADAKV
jgi:hypothetical protein